MFARMKYSDSDDGASEVREPRAIYVPIFDSFFESSIMREEVTTRFVMLALIRLAWRPRSNGIVDVDLRVFAASIMLPVADVERAIVRLMEPDEDSGSKLENGRRIIPINAERPMRGWRLVNWANYKTILHKANDKVRKQEERDRDNRDISDKTVMSPTRLDETRRDETKKEEDTRHFEESFWLIFPRKVGKAQALKAWLRLSDEERILADEGVRGFAGAWTTRPPEEIQFCPHGATWLSGRRWEDRAESTPSAQHDERAAARKADADKWAEMQATVARELAEDAAERKAHGL